MARPASGTVERHEHADGRTITYRLRVSAYGQRHRITLGTNHTGWSDDRAELEREKVVGQIERGTWEPPEPSHAAPARVEGETVHEFLNGWYARKLPDINDRTQADYVWRLDHLLYHVGRREVRVLDVRAIDQLKVDLATGDGKRAPLSPRSVNMILGLLAQALDDAVDYGLLPANPARGRRRRMKVEKASRSFLEPDMVESLLDEARAWERELPEHQQYGRRGLLATLCLSGPRISELIETPVGRLDIHAGRLKLGMKTAAGRDRELELSAFLLDELRAHIAWAREPLRDAYGADLPLFHSNTGGRLNPSNIRNRLLNGIPARGDRAPVEGLVARVNRVRAAEGRMLLPAHVTPHALRRTFASLCFFAGRDLRWVMQTLGHEDPRMTLAVYAQCMARSRVDEAVVWRLMRFPDEREEAAWIAGQRFKAARREETRGQRGEVRDGREARGLGVASGEQAGERGRAGADAR